MSFSIFESSPVIWKSGPPPHIGWWNASTETGWTYRCIWRWWNGHAWSKHAGGAQPAQHAAICAMRLEQEPNQSKMLWNDYWPEGARVPRVDPRMDQEVQVFSGEMNLAVDETDLAAAWEKSK